MKKLFPLEFDYGDKSKITEIEISYTGWENGKSLH